MIPVPVLEQSETPKECCHRHLAGRRYEALGNQPYAIGAVSGVLEQGKRYDFPDEVAKLLMVAGYLRVLNPWEQLTEDLDAHTD